ncbi:MAG: hypothetical protein KC877_02825 [Candidatus Kaiserbacteria bacterium]|nr:hypothetical protein [Candidatus Kaiserbacteria bacterium]MCB9816749.1 hypothetical protein [Candidatus Nomurabacteria bacterium]
MRVSAIFKLLVGIALAVSALAQLFQHETWWFIQNVNLIFHEAGHWIFGIFGDFIGLIGGSLLEILIPLIVTLHFVLQRHWISVAFGAWWSSTAFLSVSIYASDAQERLLPLLGGDSVLHDWYHILSRSHLLPYDDLVGYVFWLCGLGMVAMLIFFLVKDQHIQTLLNRHTLR